MKFKDIKEYGDLTGEMFLGNIQITTNNVITSLEGSQKYVKGAFNVSNNKLTSLEYCPEIIDGSFLCNNNKLTSLKGAPKIINKDFRCYNNDITTLKHSPKEIKGDFNCRNNSLTNLENCTQNIGGVFICKDNPLLKNVKEQIIKYQIKAKEYWTDDGDFSFKEIKKEFEQYRRECENQKHLFSKIKSNDYGYNI